SLRTTRPLSRSPSGAAEMEPSPRVQPVLTELSIAAAIVPRSSCRVPPSRSPRLRLRSELRKLDEWLREFHSSLHCCHQQGHDAAGQLQVIGFQEISSRSSVLRSQWISAGVKLLAKPTREVVHMTR